ncbi:MAG: hypothetical protein ACKVOR_03780, partial [Flavobacteriales bacterium]
LAVIDKKLVPSELTVKSAYQLARDFCQMYADTASFRAAADTLNGGTQITKAQNIKPNATSVQGLSNAGAVVGWTYSAEIAEVSQPIRVDNDWIIATLIDIKEQGAPTFENIKDKIKDKVIKEKKAEKYMDMMMQGTLAEIAAACSTTVKHADNVNMKATNIPSSGVSMPENKLIGALFGIPTGNISLPIVGEGGIYVIQRTTDLSLGTSTDNYLSQLDGIVSGYNSRATNDVFRSFIEQADVEDHRYTR